MKRKVLLTKKKKRKIKKKSWIFLTLYMYLYQKQVSTGRVVSMKQVKAEVKESTGTRKSDRKYSLKHKSAFVF